MFTDSEPRPKSSKRYLLLFVLAVLWGLAGLWLVNQLSANHELVREQQAVQLSRAATQAVRQRLERSLEGITNLHTMARRVRIERLANPEAEPSAMERHLKDLARAGRSGVLQVAIIDAAGSLIWSTVPGFIAQVTPVDLSDREHFRVHRDGRRTPFVSVPLVGRASGRWSVQVTQALLSEEGEFLGVAVVSIDPLRLGADLDHLDFAPGAVVTLLREDGTVLTRSGDSATFMGQKMDDQRMSRLTAQASGTGRTVSVLDGRDLLFAWQWIEGWPLLVFFGMDHRLLAEEVEAFRRMLLMVLVAVMACGGAAGLLVISQADRRAERAEAVRAANAMREATELLEAMPGAAYRGTVAASGDYEPIYLGSAITHITGWTPQEFDDPAFQARLATECEASCSRGAFMLRVIENSEAISEYCLRMRDGQMVWVRDHCRVIRPAGPDGRTQVIGLIINITEERRLKAQTTAAAKLATLGEMATGVAHELNQPCSSITLAADVAAFEMDRGTAADLASARGRLEEIARQTMRMRGVIDHFQIFGRRSEGSEDGVLDIAQAVSGALMIASGTLNAAGINMRIDVPPELPKVRGQLVPLEQVLVNLLVNARDAMREATGPQRQIEIAARHDAKKGRVALTVRDHGHGLPLADSGRLFEPFFTTKPLGEGTGLGLAIAYGTMQGFGGSIDIQDHPDGGAIATLWLNLANAALPSDEAATA